MRRGRRHDAWERCHPWEQLLIEREHRTSVALTRFWQEQRRHHEIVGVEPALDRLQVSERAKEQSGADRDDNSDRDLCDREDEQPRGAADASQGRLDAGSAREAAVGPGRNRSERKCPCDCGHDTEDHDAEINRCELDARHVAGRQPLQRNEKCARDEQCAHRGEQGEYETLGECLTEQSSRTRT